MTIIRSCVKATQDKLHKIRPLLTRLRERLLLVPKDKFLVVDEQIIPTKARSSLKQNSPKNPHKWGYKAYIMFDGNQNNTVPRNELN